MPKTYHIAIDGNEANVANRVGSNVYAYEILIQLERQTRADKTFTFTILLAAELKTDLPKEREGWQYSVIGPKVFWTQWALPLHLFLHSHNYDLFYTPGHYAPRFSSVPYVSSVMDLAFIPYPKHFKKEDSLKLTAWTKYSVQHARKVIAISEYTKQEIIKYYQKPAKDIIVAYPAVRPPKKLPSRETISSVEKKFKIYSPYILFLGTIQPRKNIETLVAAFELMLKRRMLPFKPQLVLAGKVGWLAEPIMKRIQSSSVQKYIITTDFISDREKEALLAGADATALLGLYEGFGIPPLEALHFGSIPVVSETTSLPEVVGEAGFVVDPTDTKAIAKTLTQVLTLNSTKRAQLRKHAREQVKQFSWESTTQRILETLLSVLKDKS